MSNDHSGSDPDVGCALMVLMAAIYFGIVVGFLLRGVLR